MADYYPLLAKAVAGLKETTPEARQEIYERARKALSGQLHNLDPPIPEEAIKREAQALEIAVAQIETEVAAHLTAEDGLPGVEAEFYGARDRPAPAVQVNGGAASSEPVAPEQEEETPRPPKARRFGVRGKLRERQPKEAADNGAPPGETGSFGPHTTRDEDLSAPQPLASEASDASDANGPAPGIERYNGPPLMRVEARDAFASDRLRDDGHAKRLMVVFGIVGCVVILIAIAAYRLRDRPEDLVRMQALPLQGETASGDKIADRVGAETATPSTGVGDQSRPGPAIPSLPVAHRAALLVQAKGDPTKVNTYVGTVVWRAENVSGGPDEPLRTAIRAEIEITEEKFRADVIIQKNFDATLPASHTVKLVFVSPSDGPLGNIKQVSSLQMRQENTPIGDTLAGITVPITENSFLIGLARGEAEASNLERLRTREWLDVPMVLGNGLSAKLTLEKGPSGQRVFDDAIASWQAQ